MKSLEVNKVSLTTKRKIRNIVLLLVALLISAVIYNIFLFPLDLVTGGSGGIATITNHVYGIKPSIMILIIAIACAILSLIYLGVENTIVSSISALIYPLFVEITSPLNGIIQNSGSDMMVIVVFAGILSGISNGIMYKTGYSSGGIAVISQIFEKYFKIPIAKTNGIINLIIVLIGGLFFGWTNVMYAGIIIYLNSLLINKVLLGISSNKAFYIISSEDEKIKDYIIKTLGHSTTIFETKGGYLSKKNKVILTVVPTSEYYKVTEGIKLIDKNAFFVVTDSYEVQGGK